MKKQKRTRRSEKWRRNLGRAMKGKIQWNKGKKGLQKAWNKQDISKNWLYQKYIIENKSSEELAKESNFSKWAILRALKDHNIPRKTASQVLTGTSFEERYGKIKATAMKVKMSTALKGREINYGHKISKSLKKHFKQYGFSDERRKKVSERSKRLWSSPDYRNRLIQARKQYLKEHPEELIRLRKIQYPGRETRIEKKVRAFLKEKWIENKDFYYDKYDKTKQTFYRPDFQFPDKMIVIELDGYYKHFTKEGIKKDKQREKELRKAGWKVYRFIHDDITKNFEDVKLKLQNILN